MSKRPVDLTRYPGYDPLKKNYRRRCKVCGDWIIVHCKTQHVKCHDHQGIEVRDPTIMDEIPESFYRVIECPDPYGYRPGAAFAAGEVTEMKRISTLIPGMILERCGKKYICAKNELEEM